MEAMKSLNLIFEAFPKLIFHTLNFHIEPIWFKMVRQCDLTFVKKIKIFISILPKFGLILIVTDHDVNGNQ